MREYFEAVIANDAACIFMSGIALGAILTVAVEIAIYLAVTA